VSPPPPLDAELTRSVRLSLHETKSDTGGDASLGAGAAAAPDHEAEGGDDTASTTLQTMVALTAATTTAPPPIAPAPAAAPSSAASAVAVRAPATVSATGLEFSDADLVNAAPADGQGASRDRPR
jgi:hypothetical protein